MKKVAVIVAGGSGQRMKSDTPKQFLLLKEKPVLVHTVEAFLNAYADMEVIVVVPKANIAEVEKLFIGHATERIFITAGGGTRFHSVKNGLSLIKEKSIVFVHDGVRCLVTPNLIQRCFQQAIEKGSAVPFTYATDSIRLMSDAENHSVIDRKQVAIIQTPQVFKSTIILPAFEKEFDERFTDEATVVEASGLRLHLIEGEHENIKITRPVDLVIADIILNQRG